MPTLERARFNCPDASASDLQPDLTTALVTPAIVTRAPFQRQPPRGRFSQENYMRMMRFILSASAAFLMTVLPLGNAQQPTWQISKTLHIGGDGAWDYVTVDPQTN